MSAATPRIICRITVLTSPPFTSRWRLRSADLRISSAVTSQGPITELGLARLAEGCALLPVRVISSATA